MISKAIKKRWINSTFSSFISCLVGLFISLVIILSLSEKPFETLSDFFTGVFSSSYYLGAMLNTASLFMCCSGILQPFLQQNHRIASLFLYPNKLLILIKLEYRRLAVLTGLRIGKYRSCRINAQIRPHHGRAVMGLGKSLQKTSPTNVLRNDINRNHLCYF